MEEPLNSLGIQFSCRLLSSGEFEIYVASYTEDVRVALETKARNNGIPFSEEFANFEKELQAKYGPTFMEFLEEARPTPDQPLEFDNLQAVETAIEEQRGARKRVLRNAGLGDLFKNEK